MNNTDKDIKSELCVDVRSFDIRIALLQNKKLIEFCKENNNIDFSVGDIYLGRVKKIMPGLNAVFVDIGSKKDAFLHYLDLGASFLSFDKFLRMANSERNKINNLNQFTLETDIDKNGKIADLLKIGQYILVQVEKEAISTKGPRLTCEISIASRNIILMPFSNKISVSQKIKSFEERTRLRKLIESIVPINYGVIVRTAAEKKMVAELDKELISLIEKWESLFKSLTKATPPKLILSEVSRTTAFLRDMLDPSYNQVISNDLQTYETIKSVISEIAPEKKNIVKLYTGKDPIFDYFGIERQIKSAFGKIVPLRNGAYLIIERTEAAHVIDVNSGNRFNIVQDQEANTMEVNLIAAEEIARQLRLRDLGGIIIIDFIDVRDETSKKQIYDKMKEFMDGDKARYYIAPLSKFCVMEITRQRVRPETDIKTEERCPTCKGTGQITASILITDEIENVISYIVKNQDIKNLILRVHPFIGAYLEKGLFSSLKKKWQRSYKCNIYIQNDFSYSYTEYHIIDKVTEEEIIYQNK